MSIIAYAPPNCNCNSSEVVAISTKVFNIVIVLVINVMIYFIYTDY